MLLAGLCLTLLAIRTFRHPPSAYGRPPPVHAALTAKGTIVPVATATKPMAPPERRGRVSPGQERSR